ncbi:MAG: F0F1 ATP synthase subunit delta [Candidatus Pacebacteria bacterium]|nr:F0F1 ATP synthase subunit delta [Candidatus Paceibacterota bacterium]
MEKEYAQALWQSVERGMEPHKAVQSLHESLKAHGRELLMPRIASAFGRLAQREHRNNMITLTIASEKDSHGAKRDIEPLLKELGAEAKDVETRVDPELIGGWRFEGKGKLVDASYKQALLDMYNRAVR